MIKESGDLVKLRDYRYEHGRQVFGIDDPLDDTGSKANKLGGYVFPNEIFVFLDYARYSMCKILTQHGVKYIYSEHLTFVD